MRNLDLDCLRTFLVCADAPSFADAGARVNKSQSTVSVQMRRIEETLSRPIFTKRGRRNELTAAGRELRDYAERIVRLNDEAIGRFDPKAFSARVRVGTPDDYAEVFLPGVFAHFARANPGVEVAIECRTSLDLADQIDAGELDLAVVTRDTRTRHAEHLLSERLAWFAPPDCRLELDRPVPLGLWHAGCAWRTLTLDALDRADIAYRIAYTGLNGAALIASVKAGLSVAALPARFLGAGLRRLEPGALPEPGPFEVGLLRGAAGNPVVDAFADEIRAAFANLSTTQQARVA